MIKLVIFDLDGILLDTERFNLVSKIEEAHKLGFDLKKKMYVIPLVYVLKKLINILKKFMEKSLIIIK